MTRQHQHIVLAKSLPELGLEAGDVGVVVHVHRGGEAFEVEFVTLDGETAAIATLEAKSIRAVRKGEIAHARLRVVGRKWLGSMAGTVDESADEIGPALNPKRWNALKR
jgi:hypothetical protein